MTETDENIMLAVRNGEIAKLGILFDRRHRALFDYFVRMTGRKAVADDLVQDVFFRILKYRSTFRGQGSFKAWMFHIARNALFDHNRRRAGELILEEEHAESIQGSSPMPGQQLEQQQQMVLLDRALFELSPEKREVLVLSRYHDMKYEQIAELMGCEVGAIKTRVHRAVKELREIFFRLSREKPTCNAKKYGNTLRIM